MSYLLNRMSNCHTLSANYCMVANPCFYHETPFKAAITDLVKSGQIGMVLMLMGATWQEAPGFQVSYYGKQTDYDFESRLRLKLSPLEQVGQPGEQVHQATSNFYC